MKKKIVSWLLRVLFVALFSGAGYLGFYLWRRYGPSLSPEVNAAIIEGIIAIGTMAISSLMHYYTVKRSERITLRDEMFRKRLEVYSNIYPLLWPLGEEIDHYFCYCRLEEKENLEKLIEEYLDYYSRNQFYLSEKVDRLGGITYNVLETLKEFINHRNTDHLNRYLERKTMLEYIKDKETIEFIEWFIPEDEEFQKKLSPPSIFILELIFICIHCANK